MSKLKSSFIKESISKKRGFFRANVVPPSYGLDSSIITISDDIAMAVASDPLSYIPSIGAQKSAWLSIQLVANDISTTSLSAEYGQLTLNLPESISELELEEYWDYIDLYAKQLGITITGGHTGITKGNQSTIAGGITLWTFGALNEMLLSNQAQEGDVLLMTKSAALLSSSLLTLMFPELIQDTLSVEELAQLQASFWNISVSQEAKLVRQINSQERMITAMHDVTEGGILGAIYEFCTASQLGIRVQKDKIPIAPYTAKACKTFDLDPLHSIGAGAMLMSCKNESKDYVLATMKKNNMLCTEIGHFVHLSEGRVIEQEQHESTLEEVEKDPYWVVFNKLINYGNK